MDLNETEVRGRSRHREPQPTLDLGYSDDVPIDPDPLEPHPEHPTPLEFVLRLTRSERVTRVKRLIEMAWNRYDEALDSVASQRIAGTCALVSGGNDSYTMSYLFRSVSTHWVHANTETGIEATRQHVRDTAADLGLPLIEEYPNPGEGYWDIVRGNLMGRSRETGELVQAWPGGFPGAAAHAKMYQRLKERGLARVPHRFGISGSLHDQVVFIAGRRRPESKRRATVPHFERKHTILWISPLAIWHKADLRACRLMHADLPINPVAQVLDISGECGCLANAVEGERERWFGAFPSDQFVLAVQAMEEELRPREDIPEHRKVWGWGWDPVAQEAERAYQKKLRRNVDATDDEAFGSADLCSVNCGTDPLWDLMDPLFEQGPVI